MVYAVPLPPVAHPARRAAARLWPAAALALALLTSACASSGRIAPEEAPPIPSTPAGEHVDAPAATAPSPPAESSDNHVEALLRAEVRRWEGTPHVLGGTGRSGLDCSAFVQNVFGDLFAVDLPRTTESQVETGEAVPADALQAGDLVFFTPSRKSRHVGIYLSRGEFAHVSSSRGVMISRLEERYWQDAYWTSRRVLAPLPSARTASSASSSRPPNGPAPDSDATTRAETGRLQTRTAPPRDAPESAPERRKGW